MCHTDRKPRKFRHPPYFRHKSTERDLQNKRIRKITSSGNSAGSAIAELLRNPAILRAFAYRDFKIRYVQTYLGYFWALIQPMLGLVAVFVFFFKMAGINSGEVPYPVFALSGLVFWNYFHYLVVQTASSFINMQAMIKKIYFPRLALAFSKALVGTLDLLVGIILLLGFMTYFGVPLLPLLSFPLILIFVMTAALGIGLIVSALSIRYRDLQQALPFALQLVFFLTPVAYPTALLEKVLPQTWLWITYLNPMTGILELFRYFLFETPTGELMWISLAMCPVLFIMGLIVFAKVDQKIADVI